MKRFASILFLGPMLVASPLLGGKLTKEQYFNQVETKLGTWDKTISNAKRERDALATTSSRYKHISKAIDDLEAEASDIREELRDLRASDSANWSEVRESVDESFRKMQKARNLVRSAE